jgi:hypothetical protein
MPKRSSNNPDVNEIAFQGMQSILEKLDPESIPKPKKAKGQQLPKRITQKTASPKASKPTGPKRRES